MKKILFVYLFFVCLFGHAQMKCTIDVNKYGMSAKPGYLNGGLHLMLPNDYYFYLVGDKITIGIENFDTLEQFREIENKFSIVYQDRLCDHMRKKNEDCSDTEVSYEISNSPMFGHCRVTYFYYDSYLATNGIMNSWSSIGNGDYEIIIVSDSKIYYTKKIKVRGGNLVR